MVTSLDDPTVLDPLVDVGRVEPDELANREERDGPSAIRRRTNRSGCRPDDSSVSTDESQARASAFVANVASAGISLPTW